MNEDKTTDDVSRPVAGPVQRSVRPLVERLRAGVYGLDRIALCAEAAEEIERLQTELICAREQIKKWQGLAAIAHTLANMKESREERAARLGLGA